MIRLPCQLFVASECGCVCVLVNVSLEDRYMHFICKVRVFLGCEDILSGPHKFKGGFEGYDLVSG